MALSRYNIALKHIRTGISIYKEAASAQAYKMFGYVFNRKAEGIGRAIDYAESLKAFEIYEDMDMNQVLDLNKRLVETVYRDIKAGESGVLGTSVDLREELTRSMFAFFGYGEEKLAKELERLTLERAQFVAYTGAGGLGAYGVASGRATRVTDLDALAVLEKLMKANGYSVDLDVNDKKSQKLVKLKKQ